MHDDQLRMVKSWYLRDDLEQHSGVFSPQAQAATPPCQDPMKYKTTPLERRRGIGKGDLGHRRTDGPNHCRRRHRRRSTFVLGATEMAKSDHKRFLTAQGCPRSEKKFAGMLSPHREDQRLENGLDDAGSGKKPPTSAKPIE